MNMDNLQLIYHNRIMEIYEMWVGGRFISKLDLAWYYKAKHTLVLRQLESADDSDICRRLLRKSNAAFKEYVSSITPVNSVSLEELAAE